MNVLLVITFYGVNAVYPKNVVWSSIKSKMPTTYEKPQKTAVSCASLLLLAGNAVDSGRQTATSHVPKINAGIGKMPCKAFMIKRRGRHAGECLARASYLPVGMSFSVWSSFSKSCFSLFLIFFQGFVLLFFSFV